VICSSVTFFLLKIFEETFTTGIVKRILLFGEGLYNTKGIQKLPESESIILGTAIGVKNQIG